MTGHAEADPDANDLTDAISRRPTDRRPFGDRCVPEETPRRLRRLVEAEGAYLHVVPDDRVDVDSSELLSVSPRRAASETIRIDE
jgi:hypothetical protein